MAWRDLQAEVAGIFGDLEGDDRLDDALEIARAKRRSRDSERVAEYRAARPKQTRAMKARQRARWRKANPEKHRASNRAWYKRWKARQRSKQ